MTTTNTPQQLIPSEPAVTLDIPEIPNTSENSRETGRLGRIMRSRALKVVTAAGLSAGVALGSATKLSDEPSVPSTVTVSEGNLNVVGAPGEAADNITGTLETVAALPTAPERFENAGSATTAVTEASPQMGQSGAAGAVSNP